MTAELNMFRKVNNVFIVILCKAEPEKWTPKTLLLRCLTRDKKDLCIAATGEALMVMQNLELMRAYEMEIKGSCVQMNKRGHKNGVFGEHDIRLTRKPKIAVA